MESSGNPSQSEGLKQRTKTFALTVIRLFRTLPKTADAQVIGRQLLRSSTSVAANYRAARRSRSRAEFISKIGLVVEETDESLFWLELIAESGILPPEQIEDLMKEAGELLAIFAASQRTAKANRTKLR
ncbi:MAG: four helix bundle protein [Nitrospirae bacterium]|nr:four helix bundle protein [Nitrospirota bacterium]